MEYKKLREWLSEKEHEQWVKWSKSLSEELDRIKDLIYKRQSLNCIKIINDRLERWKKNWKPYGELDEDTKESDREWADKIIDEVPFRCPVYQCGGLMRAKERPYPEGKNEDDFPDGMAGDSQMPDLVCENCGAVYQIKR